MFAFLHYNGQEPGWATSLIEAGLPAYSPARTLKEQESVIESALNNIKPNIVAYKNADALKLSENLWKSFSEVKPILFEADKLTSTDHCIWRDQWFLIRSDVLIVENSASLDLPVLSYLMDIKTVVVSFTPVGMNPWLAKCAQVTVNNPENVEDILNVLNLTPPLTDVVESK